MLWWSCCLISSSVAENVYKELKPYFIKLDFRRPRLWCLKCQNKLKIAKIQRFYNFQHQVISRPKSNFNKWGFEFLITVFVNVGAYNTMAKDNYFESFQLNSLKKYLYDHYFKTKPLKNFKFALGMSLDTIQHHARFHRSWSKCFWDQIR